MDIMYIYVDANIKNANTNQTWISSTQSFLKLQGGF